MDKLSTGAIVRLKSGGPTMTITRVIGEKGDKLDDALKEMQGLDDGDVVCTWFEGNKAREKGFPVESLQPAS